MKKSGASRMNALSGKKLQDRVFGAIKSKEDAFGKIKNQSLPPISNRFLPSC
jgi:hypothetical protein